MKWKACHDKNGAIPTDNIYIYKDIHSEKDFFDYWIKRFMSLEYIYKKINFRKLSKKYS